MTSGKTEYTREQMLTMLHHYQKKAAEDWVFASMRIAEKLLKNGISQEDFHAFVKAQEEESIQSN